MGDFIYAFVLGLLIVFGLASTRLTKKIKLPNVTGFLVVGILIGGICIGLDYAIGHGQMPDVNAGELSLTVELNQLNGIIASVALGFIALSIGEEFKISKMKSYGTKVTIVTLFQSLLAAILVGGLVAIVCYFTKVPYYIAFILGAIATATAPAATLMVINQYKARGPLVNLLLPIVALDDAIGLIIFSLAVSVAKVLATGGTIDWLVMILLPLINIFGSLALGLVLGLFMKLLIRFFASRHNHLMMIIAFTLLGVGACSIINHFCTLKGEHFEFSNLLTCMMIGATYINVGRDLVTKERDFHLVDRWSPFLLLLFFVLSGSQLVTSAYSLFANNETRSVLVPSLIIFGVYLLARSLGKYLGAFFGCLATKQSKSTTKYLGITLLPQAGVAIGMANQISNTPEFATYGSLIVTVVLCATLVYELFGPLLTKISLVKAGEINLSNEETPFGEVAELNDFTSNIDGSDGNANNSENNAKPN